MYACHNCTSVSCERMEAARLTPTIFGYPDPLIPLRASRVTAVPTVSYALRVYSDRMRQRHNDGVKHNALELEHMFVNRSIQTGRVASDLRGNPKGVDFFVIQEQSRRAVSSTTLRLLC